jgi:hypothetical protein
MKHELKLLPAESLKVQVALANEIESLKSGFRQDWTNQIYKKFDFTKGQATLDGGEMEIVIQSLRKIAHAYVKRGRSIKAISYFTVAAKVNDEKKLYQFTNGPKIEKTASAGTLTA